VIDWLCDVWSNKLIENSLFGSSMSDKADWSDNFVRNLFDACKEEIEARTSTRTSGALRTPCNGFKIKAIIHV
jgi:hypothetical protein